MISTVIGISVACAGYKSASSPSAATDATPNVQTSSPQIDVASQDKPSCNLNISHAPVLHGLKLRMTTDEVLSLFPGSKDDPELRTLLSEPPSRFGGSSFPIKPSKYATNERFLEINNITFNLLDGRVSSFSLGFNGPEWPHVDKFVAKLVENTSLPQVDQWQPYVGMDNQVKTLTCADFSIRVFVGGPGGNLNSVLIDDLEADAKLKERRRKAREQASPTQGQ